MYDVTCDQCDNSIDLTDVEDIGTSESVGADYDDWFIGVESFDDEPGILLIDTVACPEHDVDEEILVDEQ